MLNLTREDFEDFRRHVHEICGLSLGDDKMYLVEQRFGPLLGLRSLKTFAELRGAMRGREAGFWREQMIVAITTNETSFFRDTHPFDLFVDHVLPRLAHQIVHRRAEGRTGISDGPRIWCAASSTGQEPYSIAMLIAEYCAAHVGRGFNLPDFRILGTDISSRVLERAKTGIYQEMEVSRGVSPERRARHFDAVDGSWRVKDDIRKCVSFVRINLMEPFMHLGMFDVIFCRNVLIYFDDATKRMIASGMAQALNADGELFVGAAESLYGLSDEFEQVESSNSIVYRCVHRRMAAGG